MADVLEQGNLFKRGNRGIGTFLSSDALPDGGNKTIRMSSRIVESFWFKIFCDEDITVRLDTVVDGVLEEDLISRVITAAESPFLWQPLIDIPDDAMVVAVTTTNDPTNFGIDLLIKRK